MANKKEYMITLKNKEDLDSFYQDIETLGAKNFIPKRAVPVENRRPVSRTTHYKLSKSEAEKIAKDPRVLSVEPALHEINAIIKPLRTISSSLWNKSNTLSSQHQNWGLLRCVNGEQITNWGSDGTTNVTDNITLTSTGKNVDVVIVDGLVDPSHPEFAVNSDGTGGSRIVQFNWFELNPYVTGGIAGTYQYSPYVDPSYPDNDGDGQSDRTVSNDHGAAVASVMAGNYYGWAKDSTIYNISPYSNAPSATSFFIDYIRVWHSRKLPNSNTGIKNPTISNHSYGISIQLNTADITSVRYRGTVYNAPFTSDELFGFGIYNASGIAEFPYRSVAYEQDLIDAIDEGIIVAAAAGNEYSTVSNYSTDVNDDYNNYISDGVYIYYYSRGTISAADGVICVGAIGTLKDDSKAPYSNAGPRVDIYAPGSYITLAVNSALGVVTTDIRDPSYSITKKSGTSFSSPQVAGVLACLAESRPRLTQSEALEYIINTAKIDQITDVVDGLYNFYSIKGSENRYLFYYKERPESGQVGPKINMGNRPVSGQAWPRNKIFRHGS